MPSTTDHDVFDQLLLRLGAASPEDIELQPAASLVSLMRIYRATCGNRWAYVDRVLAIMLRERGAGWSGELRLDPCGVA